MGKLIIYPHLYLAKIEILIGVRQPSELPGAAIQVDIAGPKDGQEAHLRLPCISWRQKEAE